MKGSLTRSNPNRREASDAAARAVRLAESGAEPRFRQIYASLRDAILAQRLSAGTKLPSTRALAAELRAARNTVALAYDQLLAEGLITTRSGSGTYVASAVHAVTRRRPATASSSTPTSLRVATFGEELRRDRYHVPAALRVGGAFAPGEPDVRAFPAARWTRLLNSAARQHGAALLTYGDANGYGPLRRAILDHVTAARGVRAQLEQVFLVRGAQQAFDLIARTLLERGDSAAVEDPGYLQVRALLAAHGCDIRFVAVDGEGLVVDELASMTRAPRVLFVTPSNHFPLGVTMSLPRRLALLEVAVARGCWIVEDDYDSEFRYSGRPLPCLQGIDRSGVVLYTGTFSKTVFPALRIGYVIVPPALVDVFARARAMLDTLSPTHEHAALSAFMHRGHFVRHVRRMRELYRDRLVALVSAAQRLAPTLHIAPPDGGMNAVAWLESDLPDSDAALAAARHGVEVRPLSLYCEQQRLPPALVLGFASHTEPEIADGMRRLGVALREWSRR